MLDTGEKKQKSVRWGLPGGPVDRLCVPIAEGSGSIPGPQPKKRKKKKYKTILYKKAQNKEKLINAILKAFFFSFLQIRKRLWFFHFLWQRSFCKSKTLGHGLQMDPNDER